MARVVKSLLLLLGVAAGFQAAPLLRPASQAAVSRCAADSIQVRAALFSKHGGSLEGSLELDACNALPSGGAGAVGSALCIWQHMLLAACFSEAEPAKLHPGWHRHASRRTRTGCTLLTCSCCCEQMSKICDITGKRSNNANRVSFSNKKWARLQEPNLQTKRLFSKELDRFVRLKVATSTLRTIRKLGLDETAKKYEIDLNKF